MVVCLVVVASLLVVSTARRSQHVSGTTLTLAKVDDGASRADILTYAWSADILDRVARYAPRTEGPVLDRLAALDLLPGGSRTDQTAERTRIYLAGMSASAGR